MHGKVAIVTVSTAYLPQEDLRQYSISVIPLSVIWSDQVYMDGVNMMPAEFYQRLADSKAMPTTSQVMLAVMQFKFESLLLQGYDVLGIFLSSKISGTVQSASQAHAMLPYAAENIAIVDSLSTTMAMRWPVLTAARAAEPFHRNPDRFRDGGAGIL